ncbi:hypothetical protein BC629DRAFT_1536388 [Irpex lacteus]|nr:hypothetical protein BC629DRAFT_1536388 [Irpex lacteus]
MRSFACCLARFACHPLCRGRVWETDRFSVSVEPPLVAALPPAVHLDDEVHPHHPIFRFRHRATRKSVTISMSFHGPCYSYCGTGSPK